MTGEYVDRVLANLKEAYRERFAQQGYDIDNPEDMKRLEADVRPLLDFYEES